MSNQKANSAASIKLVFLLFCLIGTIEAATSAATWITAPDMQAGVVIIITTKTYLSGSGPYLKTYAPAFTTVPRVGVTVNVNQINPNPTTMDWKVTLTQPANLTTLKLTMNYITTAFRTFRASYIAVDSIMTAMKVDYMEITFSTGIATGSGARSVTGVFNMAITVDATHTLVITPFLTGLKIAAASLDFSFGLTFAKNTNTSISYTASVDGTNLVTEVSAYILIYDVNIGQTPQVTFLDSQPFYGANGVLTTPTLLYYTSTTLISGPSQFKYTSGFSYILETTNLTLSTTVGGNAYISMIFSLWSFRKRVCPSTGTIFYEKNSNLCYDVCPAGYQPVTTTNYCQKCAVFMPYCLFCSSKVYCTQCATSFIFITGNTGCQCAPGYYDNAGACTACHSSCATCTGGTSNDCLSCSSTNNVLVGKTCMACHSTCATCSGTASNQCITCSTGLQLYGTSCIVCDSSCQTCSGGLATNCLSCKNTTVYLNSNNACVACPTACVTCSSAISCLSCVSSKYLSASNWCEPCHSSCLTCNGGLSTNCLSCNTAVRTLSGTQCLCNTGTRDYLGTCVALCTDVKCDLCLADVNVCTQCKNNLVLSGTVCGCPSNKYYSSGDITCYNCHATCLTCSGPSSSQCTSCDSAQHRTLLGTSCVPVSTYYDDGTNAIAQSCDSSVCVDCSMQATNCTSCSSTKFYTPYTCTACSWPCASCSDATTCLSCATGLTLAAGAVCKCPSGNYANTGTQTCTQCSSPMPHCLTCDSGTVCTQCAGAYYLNAGSTCTACMPGCTSCSSGPICDSCDSGWTLLSQACTCTPGNYIGTGGSSCNVCPSACVTCSSDTVCLSCSSTMYLSASNWCENCPSTCLTCSSNTVCLTCVSSKYLSASNWCEPCHSSCLTCNGGLSTNCLSCNTAVRTLTGTQCLCNTGTRDYLGNCVDLCADVRCDLCLADVNVCTQCKNNLVLSGTVCGCPSNKYYSSGDITCYNCHATCLTCSGPSSSQCTSCDSAQHRTLLGTSCVPVSTYYDDGTNAIAQSCDSSVCVDCSMQATNCTSCSSTKFYTPYTCTACSWPCASCSDATTCLSCATGLTLAAGAVCKCPSGNYANTGTQTCTQCSSPMPHCLTCDSGTVCTQCAGAYYLNAGSTCTACMPGCTSCSSGPICDSCDSGWTLLSQACTCTPGNYIGTGGSSCNVCPSACVTCSSDTVCLSCSSTMYLSASNWCENCPSTCLTCSSDTVCLTCVSSKYLSASNWCEPCHSSCLTCDGGLSTNCLSCNTAVRTLTGTQCLCNTGTRDYLGNCVDLCADVRCDLCLADVNVCTQCKNNLVLSGTVCGCPSNKYYSSGDITCYNCHATCLTCSGPSSNQCLTCSAALYRQKNPSTSTCDCKNSFYLSVSTQECQACPSSCLTCSSDLVCLTCASTKYLTTSNWCEPCHQTCKTCNGPLNSNCLTCNTKINDAQNYKPAFINLCTDIKCDLCPADPSICSVCRSNLILSGTVCGCPSNKYYSSGDITCYNCHATCLTCSGPSSSECTSCDSAQHRTLLGTSCVPVSTYYDDGTNAIAQSCDSSVCVDCSMQATNCTSCSFTKFYTPYTCTACSWPCASCSDATTCLSCATGLTLAAGAVCKCPSGNYANTGTQTCTQCSSPMPHCLTCDSDTVCTQCAGAYYLNAGSTCTACMPGCTSCSSGPICDSCDSGWTLLSQACTCTPGNYIGTGGSSCNVCPSACVTCSSDTVCLSCSSTMYLSASNWCENCPSTCLTCSSDTVCLTCVSSKYLSASNWCEPCHSSCLTCDGGLSTNCLSCNTAVRTLTGTQCLCNTGTRDYLGNCVDLCADVRCDLCLADVNVCTQCKNNLVLSGTVCGCPSNKYYSSGDITCYNCHATCLTCSGPSSSECTSCDSAQHRTLLGTSCVPVSTYYDDGTNAIAQSCDSSVCVDCSMQATNCTSCSFTKFYTPYTCTACSWPCASCSDATTCLSCATGLTLAAGAVCKCPSGNYANTGTQTCTQCSSPMPHCLTCDSDTVCTQCAGAYYLNAGSTCTACMPGCTSCSSGPICDSCDSGWTLLSQACTCTPGNYIGTGGSSCNVCPSACVTCSSDTVCLSCSSTMYLSASNWCENCPSTCLTCSSDTVCLTCVSSKYLSASNWCEPCHSSCLTCDGGLSTNCLSCNTAVRTLTGTQCLCNTGTRDYLGNCVDLCADVRCDLCLADVNVCTQCKNNLVLSGTVCGCPSNKYYSSGDITCYNCHATCLTCSGPSSSECTSCDSAQHRTLLGTSCVPVSTYYDDGTNAIAQSCDSSVCVDCSMQATNCTSCSFTKFYTPYTCTACSWPCASCSDATTCLSCATGLTLAAGAVCKCPSGNYANTGTQTCTQCSSPMPHCLTCDSDTVCTQCAGAYYLNAGSTCTACMPGCTSCSSGPICDSCDSGWTLLSQACTCTPGNYIGTGGSSCNVCPSACVTCSSDTVCLSCSSTMYLSASNWCENCPSTCLTCSSDTVCLTCVSSKYLSASNWCEPCHSSCLTCDGGLSTNCLSCNTAVRTLTGTQCLCNTGTRDYLGNCVDLCADVRCDLCLADVNVCTQCKNNLVLSGTVCGCPSNKYYSSGDITCYNCHATCLTCSGPSSSECTSCDSAQHRTLLGTSCVPVSTYYDDGTNAIAQSCDSSVCVDCSMQATNCTSCSSTKFYTPYTCTACSWPCASCSDATTCLSCATGLTLAAGAVCKCPSGNYANTGTQTCTQCSSPMPHCLTCDSDTVCTQCAGAYYLNAGSTCTACMPGCTSCSSGPICDSCDSGWTLLSQACTCTPGNYIGTGGSSCNVCPSACVTCSSDTVCLSCSSTMYLSASNWCENCPSTCLTCSSDTVCLTCVSSKYLSASNWCEPCHSSCLTCDGGLSTNCLSCNTAVRTLTGTQCLCNTGTRDYLGNCVDLCADVRCDLCLADVNVCTQCKNNLVLSGTVCGCPSNKYYSSGDITCYNCHATCLTCSGPSSSECTSCDSAQHRTLLGTSCVPVSTYYDDGTNAIAQSCDSSVCVDCSMQATNCTSCSFTKFYTPYTCTACSWPCASCSDATTCLSCATGLTLAAGAVCKCPSGNYANTGTQTCTQCSSPMPHCLTCDSDTVCTQCAGAYYLNAGSTCTACMPGCTSCSSGPICDSCDSGWTLLSQACTCTPGNYIGTGGSSCNVCPSACVTCSSDTVCLSCSSTMYLSASNWCENCPSTCLTCSSDTVCLTCVSSKYLSASNWCEPCHSSCLTCDGGLSTNCLSCNTAVRTLTGTQCLCNTGTRDYLGNCVDLCADVRCDLCLADVNVCTQCKNNLVLSGTVCGCPSNKYYSSGDITCYNCHATCLTCSGPSSTQCLTCSSQLYRQMNTSTSSCDCKRSLSSINDSLPCTCGQGHYVNQTTSQCNQICGDGKVYEFDCDDGNLQAGDGCNQFCRIEDGYSCINGSSTSPSVCSYSGKVLFTLVDARKEAHQNKINFQYELYPQLQFYQTNSNFIPYLTISNSVFQIVNAVYLTDTKKLSITVTYSSSIKSRQLFEISFRPPTLPYTYALKGSTYIWEAKVSNSLSMDFYEQVTYESAQGLQIWITILFIATIILFVCSLIFRKMIGIEMIFLIQTEVISAAVLKNVHPYIGALSAGKFVFGFNGLVTRTHLGYQKKVESGTLLSLMDFSPVFGQNVNIMVLLVVLIYLIALLLWVCSKYVNMEASAKIRRVVKVMTRQVAFGLVLFSILNIIVSLLLQITILKTFSFTPVSTSVFKLFSFILIISSFIAYSIYSKKSKQPHRFYNKDSRIAQLQPLFLAIKFMILGILIVLFSNVGEIGIYCLMGMEVGYTIFVGFLKPFKRKIDLVRSIIIEVVLVYILVVRLLSVKMDDAKNIDDRHKFIGYATLLEYSLVGIALISSYASYIYHIVKLRKQAPEVFPEKSKKQEKSVIQQSQIQSESINIMNKSNYSQASDRNFYSTNSPAYAEKQYLKTRNNITVDKRQDKDLVRLIQKAQATHRRNESRGSQKNRNSMNNLIQLSENNDSFNDFGSDSISRSNQYQYQEYLEVESYISDSDRKSNRKSGKQHFDTASKISSKTASIKRLNDKSSRDRFQTESENEYRKISSQNSQRSSKISQSIIQPVSMSTDRKRVNSPENTIENILKRYSDDDYSEMNSEHMRDLNLVDNNLSEISTFSKVSLNPPKAVLENLFKRYDDSEEYTEVTANHLKQMNLVVEDMESQINEYPQKREDNPLQINQSLRRKLEQNDEYQEMTMEHLKEMDLVVEDISSQTDQQIHPKVQSPKNRAQNFEKKQSPKTYRFKNIEIQELEQQN